jgi:hypothetical protein
MGRGRASKLQGKLWIDKSDFGWIKVEGQVTQSFSLGLFVASVQEVRAIARILFLNS